MQKRTMSDKHGKRLDPTISTKDPVLTIESDVEGVVYLRY